MSIAILQPTRNCNGEKVKGIWNLVTWKRKDGTGYRCLSWHLHEKSCRYGVYWNPNNCGLKACLNIPIVGDFALWV